MLRYLVLGMVSEQYSTCAARRSLQGYRFTTTGDLRNLRNLRPPTAPGAAAPPSALKSNSPSKAHLQSQAKGWRHSASAPGDASCGPLPADHLEQPGAMCSCFLHFVSRPPSFLSSSPLHGHSRYVGICRYVARDVALNDSMRPPSARPLPHGGGDSVHRLTGPMPQQ